MMNVLSYTVTCAGGGWFLSMRACACACALALTACSACVRGSFGPVFTASFPYLDTKYFSNKTKLRELHLYKILMKSPTTGINPMPKSNATFIIMRL